MGVYPHPKDSARPACSDCHDEAPQDVAGSVHGALEDAACASCHGDTHAIGFPARRAGALCASCHSDEVKAVKISVHAGAGHGQGCGSCHGPAHRMRAAESEGSTVAKKALPSTCGACHSNPDFVARHRIDFARPVEAYRLSVHGRAVERGNGEAASCSDCHGSHDIRQSRDPLSSMNHWNVPRTCGACHVEIRQAYNDSVHGQAVERGVDGAPVCTDCHGEHEILAPSEPESLVNPARVSTVTCGHCHADERLTAKYNLPRDKVLSYSDSFHGLAQRSGQTTVANCASCHGVHNILPSSDPESMVHPKNLARTCGACHPGAGARFKIGPIHVQPGAKTEHAMVRWIRVAYAYFIIPFTLGFMILHNAVDFFAKLVRGVFRSNGSVTVPRMNVHFRIEHALVVVSFPILVVTGFALTFPDSWWSAPLLALEGSFGFRGLVHRVAAVALISALSYHVVHLIASRRDRTILRHLWPSLKDLADLWGSIRYNLGISRIRPTFGAFSYAEKAEYWAFLWGTAVMGISGLLLWFNNFTLAYLPSWAADAATAVHFYEAILAALSILVWHLYMVIFDPEVYPMDRSWITGLASADHLLHTRPEYVKRMLTPRNEKQDSSE
jgi:cytochrome b subunit of formate dehydrogenase